MEVTKAQKRKEHRERLFKEQEGRCYYCGHKMTLINSDEHGNPPINFATFEHLFDRFHKDRQNWQQHIKDNVRRIVLACRKCNHKKGKESERENIEEHRIRSKRPTVKKPRTGPERRIVYSTEVDK